MARRLVVALVVRHVIAKSLDQVEDPSVYLDSRFRLKPGCVDAYVERGGDGRFLDPDYELRTREALRFGAAPRLAVYKEAKVPTINGTAFVYVVNRKAASRTLQDVASALHAAGDRGAPKKRVVVFTFVRDPLRRLESGYKEIVFRHVDGRWCAPPNTHRWDSVCTHAYAKLLRGSRERFEGFLNATLLGPIANLSDDAMSYHVLSQSRQFAHIRNVAFVGKIERLRADVLRLLRLAVDDPEAFLAAHPALEKLVEEDETNWSAGGNHPMRAIHARLEKRVGARRLAEIPAPPRGARA
ncbi:hypothetical protein JL722_4900 [Aureococcus anophagefferens]|nr:hypothetical protein JL722_4900 [Aureococcus anophagefferens]